MDIAERQQSEWLCQELAALPLCSLQRVGQRCSAMSIKYMLVLDRKMGPATGRKVARLRCGVFLPGVSPDDLRPTCSQQTMLRCDTWVPEARRLAGLLVVAAAVLAAGATGGAAAPSGRKPAVLSFVPSVDYLYCRDPVDCQSFRAAAVAAAAAATQQHLQQPVAARQQRCRLRWRGCRIRAAPASCSWWQPGTSWQCACLRRRVLAVGDSSSWRL